MNSWIMTVEKHIGAERAATTLQLLSASLITVTVLVANWQILIG